MIKFIELYNNKYLFFISEKNLKFILNKNNNYILCDIFFNNLNNSVNKFFSYFINFNKILNNLFYVKLFNIGLGYKNFVYNKFLYIYVGDSNYLKLKYDKSKIYIICKKNQLFFFSKFKNLLYSFVNKIIKLKKINLYKGKGIIFYKNFKFMRLKKGKKKN